MVSDDSRGHDDGDISTGAESDREAALDIQVNAFFLDLAATSMYSPEELAEAAMRTYRRLKP